MSTRLQNINIISKKIIFFCLIIFPFVALPIQAQEINLTVTGVGSSKAEAIIDAQRNALRTSYGEFVSTNLTILNNELTKNETVNLVSGTIKDFKILSESVNDFSEPPIIEVLIKVTVNKGQLISFAKAIGDSVEIQGSLYAAELQLQDINKKNEAVAIEHLVKKAEIMSSFFDYQISVDNPQLTYDEFYISGSMSLKTNQNYINLLKTIRETLKEISMTRDERAKYAKFGTPFYEIEIMNIVEPGCLDLGDEYIGGLWEKYDFYRQGNYSSKDELYPSIPATPSSSCSAEWPYECGDGMCGIGGVEIFFLRSNEIFDSLMEIERRVVKSILELKLYRKMKSYKKLLFPNDFSTQEPGWNDSSYKKMVNACKRDTIGTTGEYKDRLNAMRCAARGKEALNEMVLKFILNNDKELISDNQEYRYLITYKDCRFSEYAFDINRLYHRSEFGHNRLMWANYIEAAYIVERSWGRNDLKFMPGINVDNETGCKMRTGLDIWVEGGRSVPILDERYVKRDYYYINRANQDYYPYSEINPVFTVGKSFGGYGPKIGVFHFYPINSTFAVLRYEDKGKRIELSEITEYSVVIEE